jgi:hypothetical protein
MADLGSIAVSMGDLYQKRVFNIAPTPVTAGVTVSGAVYDDTGAAAARTVRVYRRSDGTLIAETTSDAVTGAYSVTCPAGEVQRIVLDDAAGTTYNDIIDRVIPA